MQKTKHVRAEYLNRLDRLSVTNKLLSDKILFSLVINFIESSSAAICFNSANSLLLILRVYTHIIHKANDR